MAVTVHKNKSKLKIIILTVFISLLVIFAAVTGFIMADCNDIEIGRESITVEIGRGASVSSVAEQLKNDGIIKHPTVFRIVSRMNGYDGMIKPGSVVIKNKMSYKDILEALIKDNRNSRTLVIPEGFEMKQIAARLESEGFCTAQEFYTAAQDEYPYSFLAELPAREMRLEGYLYPDTYTISPGASAHDIIDMMLSEFDRTFNDTYISRAEEMNMTIDQIVTMASIIERETDSSAERAKVAGVFYNRIKTGMRLQSCATVQYILGERKPVLSISDTQIDSPYNTYMKDGLPAGPIANPGIDCIEAALYPEETSYLYFVAGADGKHIFSETYEEHMAASNSNVTSEGAQQ